MKLLPISSVADTANLIVNGGFENAAFLEA